MDSLLRAKNILLNFSTLNLEWKGGDYAAETGGAVRKMKEALALVAEKKNVICIFLSRQEEQGEDD